MAIALPFRGRSHPPEQRAAPRYRCPPATLVLVCRPGTEGHLEGWAHELSRSGIGLNLAEPLDVGSAQHWVCGPATRADGKPNVRLFGTTTDQLTELADWLAPHGVESVAMESTSVYGIPIYELLEARGIEVLLVNARQLHNGPLLWR